MCALRVRTRNTPSVMLVFVLASFFFGQSEAAVTSPSFCYLYMAIEVMFAEKNAVFRDFFPLWSNIFPYTYRGPPMMCTSSILFYFHGESQPNI